MYCWQISYQKLIYYENVSKIECKGIFNHFGWEYKSWPLWFSDWRVDYESTTVHPNLLRQIALFQVSKDWKSVSHCAWRGSERKMSTKNGRRYMMNRSLNEILKSIKLHYKLSLSRIIFSFPIVYKQNDPWPILSFTFSHNRLLMDFSQEKWILRDLLMMLSSTNISFIFQPG